MKMFNCCSGLCGECANNHERTGVDCGAGPVDDYYIPFDPIKEAKRLADQGDFDPPENRDDCVRCQGHNGGVPGNENMLDGLPVCDYCTAEELRRLDYSQKLAKTVALLKERTRDIRVRVERHRLITYLHIATCGDLNTYTTYILPLIRKDFPEAHMTSSWFTPEPWASDPYMKVTTSLDPKEQSMKTIYQACDGKIFEDLAKAVDHEHALFDAWLDAVITGHIDTNLSDVVCYFNDSPELSGNSEDEYHRTPWDVLRDALKTYWESL